jgi:nucleotide-binding universal stress UspA family protein
MAMPPMLRAALAGIPMSKEEETRINREAIDRSGFLPSLERLLLAADASAVGRMAARLAGLVAGAQGMPVTILRLDKDLRQADAPAEEKKTDAERNKEAPGTTGHAAEEGSRDDSRKEISGAQSREESGADLKADPLAREVKAGAKKSAAKVIADEAEPDPEKVHLTARIPVDAPAEVVKDEARKGYDLMFIGLQGSVEPDGSFAARVDQIAAGFGGPLMVLADGAEQSARLTSRSRLLVPVNGSPQSRRAAEIAFAIARGTGCKVQALFVSQNDGRSRTRAREEGVLKDMTGLGDRYGVVAATRISARGAPADAIIQESRRNYAMIVMGVSARPGEALFFGNTATKVVGACRMPVLFVAT